MEARPASIHPASRWALFATDLVGLAFVLRVTAEAFAQRGYVAKFLGAPFWSVAVVLTAAAMCSLATVLGSGPGVVARVQLLVVAAVLAAAAYLVLVQPFQLLFLLLTLAVAWGLYSAFVLLVRRRSGRGRLRRVAFALALALVLVECSLRVVARVAPSALTDQRDARAAVRVHHHRAAPGLVRLGFPVNAAGYYDEDLDPTSEEALVVAVADSFGFGAVPHARHFTTVAETGLDGVEVYNMGIPAIGPPEYLHLIETEALALAPDAILVCLFVGNDVPPSGPHGALEHWLRLVFDRENLLLDAIPRRWLQLREEREATGATPGADLGAEEPAWVEDPLLEPPSFSEALFLEHEADRARMVCRPGASSFEGLFRWLERIVAAAGDVPLGIVLFPDEFQVEDELWSVVSERLAEDELERDLPQRVIGAWLSVRGVPFLDPLPALRETEPLEDGRRHVYHLRDTHFNARGNAVVGRELAPFVQELLGR